jgi:hypothetical protein
MPSTFSNPRTNGTTAHLVQRETTRTVSGCTIARAGVLSRTRIPGRRLLAWSQHDPA